MQLCPRLCVELRKVQLCATLQTEMYGGLYFGWDQLQVRRVIRLPSTIKMRKLNQAKSRHLQVRANQTSSALQNKVSARWKSSPIRVLQMRESLRNSDAKLIKKDLIYY